jgi:hypothetical protein
LSSLTPDSIEEANSDEECAPDPMVILVFDEAHTLTKTDYDHPWTNFGELRKNLRTLNHCSLFSFFLSTTGRFTQFVSAREKDESMRVLTGRLMLIKPFTDLGFDPLARVLKAGELKLSEVTKEEFMVRFGRPL